MKVVLSLYLLLFGVHISACSNEIDNSKSRASGLTPAKNVVLNSEVNFRNTAVLPIETSSANPRDVVLFDGKNYIKKSGWKTPSRNDTYIDESYDQNKVEGVTESGKQVRTNTIFYLYKIKWLYSEDFYYAGRDLDYLKGQLELLCFLETSVNGKVFMYSLTAQKVVPAPSNTDHEHPTIYQIQDRNGDGIFETLLGKHDDEIIIPNWVLK